MAWARGGAAVSIEFLIVILGRSQLYTENTSPRWSWCSPSSAPYQTCAGSSEVLISVFAGKVATSGYLGSFLLPATLGNIIGGVFLVALLTMVRSRAPARRPPWPVTQKKTKKGALEPARRRSADCWRGSPSLEYRGPAGVSRCCKGLL